jgi:hypothetical protein
MHKKECIFYVVGKHLNRVLRKIFGLRRRKWLEAGESSL